MKSGLTAAEQNILRNRPQTAIWYLAVHRPASLVSAVLDAAPVSYPVSALSVNTMAGASSLTKDHQTIWVGTTAGGSQKGRLRLRKALTSATLMQVAENGSGLVNYQVGDHLTVVNQHLPWTKHPRYDSATSQWLMDYSEGYVAQLQNYGPLIAMGTPVAGFLSNGAFSASFAGASTLLMDGATATTVTWNFPNGSTSSALGTEANPRVINFGQASPNGDYVYLTVVDSTGASHRGARPIWVFNDRTQPHRVEFGQIQGGLRQGGYSTEIRVVSDATSAAFPDMAEVLIFEEASYGTIGSSVGGNFPFRPNTVLRGWIVGDTVRVNPLHGDVSFRIHTIDGIMGETYSYDAFLANASAFPSASNWIAAQNLSVDRMAVHMLKHRSTVGDLVDFTPASGIASTENIAFQDLPAGNWRDQMILNYGERGIAGYFSSDMQSNLFASFDAQISGTSANLPNVMHLQKRDRRDQVVIDRAPIDKLAEVQVFSVTGGTEDSASRIGALSPGDVRGYFGGLREHARGLFLSSQDLAATWAGNIRAKGNNPYPKTTVPLAGNYRIDSVPQSRITMSLSAIDNPREISWNDETFLPYETRLNYDSRTGTVLTEIEMERVVQGIGGSAITFPLVAVAPSDDPPTIPELPAPLPVTPGSGFGTVYVVTNERVGRTRDFSAGSPVWDILATSQSDFGASICDFILDPWRPKEVSYLMSSCGLYRSSNMTSSTPDWDLVLTRAQITTAIGLTLESGSRAVHRVLGSINEDGYVGVAMATSSNERYYAHSHNSGTTWTFANVVDSPFAGLRFAGTADIVPWTVNGDKIIYFASNKTSGINVRPFMYKSTDHGHTFSQGGLLENAHNITRVVFTPYDGNESGNIVYAGGRPNGGIMRSTDGGVNFTTLRSNTDPNTKRWGIEAYTQNKDRMYAWTEGTDFRLSDDGFVTSSAISFNGLLGSEVVASGGFPYNNELFYAVTLFGIHASTDRGSNWINKNGNWPEKADKSRELGAGTNVGVAELAYAHTVVPIWISE